MVAEQGIPAPPLYPRRVLMGLASAVNRAVGCARAEISRLLKAIEVGEYCWSNVRTIRASNVFYEGDFSRLVSGNSPGPGVRNDRSYHPGKTLAPIEITCDKLEDALIRQTLNIGQGIDYRSSIRANPVHLGE
jgi:hypothetical protein